MSRQFDARGVSGDRRLVSKAVMLALLAWGALAHAPGAWAQQPCNPDLVPPTMALVGSITQEIPQGGTFVDLGVEAIDNCDGDISDQVVRTGDVNTSVPGVYTLRYDITDAAGNAAPPIFRQPVVQDVVAVGCRPTIDCPPNPITPGSAVTFTVTQPCIQGQLQYAMFFNGAVIQQNGTGIFVIDNVDCDDAGWYTIVVSNAVSSVQLRCELIIEPCGEGEGAGGGEGEGEGGGTIDEPPCDLFATCFTGLQSPLPPNPPYVANNAGFSMVKINGQIPPTFPTLPPIPDVNWTPPMSHNETGSQLWNGNNMGQVFGIALDNQVPPNIYVTATSVYGDFVAGPGGYGAVYRINGVTGSICVLTTLPNAGPALGNVCYEPVHNALFVTNMEDGLIYRIPLGSGCTPAGAITTFDHGVAGRTAASFTPIADAGTLGTFTALGRRVWAVEDFGGRLFYSTWWENSGRLNFTEENEIWSVQLDGSGIPIPATTQRELQMPAGGYYNPVSDINFTADGDMFVSERTMTTSSHPAFAGETGDRGVLHLGLRPAHGARLMKFMGPIGGPWITNNEFRVGSFGSGTNSAGGAAIDCLERPWSTGDALHFGSSTGHTDVLYGLHHIDAAGNQFDVPFTANGILIGFGASNGGFAKTELGDVELWCPQCDDGTVEGEGHREGEGVVDGVQDGEEGEGEPCENIQTVTCQAGIKDQFSTQNGPETTTPSNALLNAVTCQVGPLTQFDVIPDAQCFVHTFDKCCTDNCQILSAHLEMGLKAASIGIITSDDKISLGTGGGFLWSLPFANLASNGTYQSGAWNPGDLKLLTLDLASLPLDANPANNVSLLNIVCNLDIMIEDATLVDYMKLTIRRCCDDGTGGEEGEGHGGGEGGREAETGEAETGEAETGEAETGEAETGEAETGEAEEPEAEEGEAEDIDPCVSWLDDLNFEDGHFFNIVPVQTGDDLCIELAADTKAFPYISIANSSRHTLTRAEVNTGDATGEFLTRPQGKDGNPSRTTVDGFGNTWVGNRDEGIANNLGSVTRVGLIIGGTRVDAASNPDPTGDYVLNPSYCTCEDRDFDGLIKTSLGYPWVNGSTDYTPTYLPWPNTGGVDSNGGVSTAEDECITAYVRVAGTNVRFVAVDPFNNVWTGGLGNRLFQRINGNTGAVVPASVFNSICGGYGGLVDPANVIWSAYWSGYGDGFMRYNVPFTSSPLTCVSGVLNYGVAIDPATCNIWTTSATFDNNARVVSPAGVLLNTYNHAGFASPNLVPRGIVVSNGTVWVAHSGSNTVGRLTTAGVHQGNVTVGSGPTGVAVDTNGKVWATNLISHTASRIDPTTIPGTVDKTLDLGPNSGPYNYSDMTGSVLLQAVAPQGHWTTIYDGGVLGCNWSPISWTAIQDPGTTIVVRVRASDSPFPSGPWTVIGNNVPFSGVVGRYIQIQIIMTRPAKSKAKVKLCDLKLCKESGCMKLNVVQKDCDPETGDVTTSFSVTNLSGVTATQILITPQTPNVTITPSQQNVNIPYGGTANFTAVVSGAVPGETTCFTVTLINRQGQVCCSQTICVRFDCAACLEFLNEKIECDPQKPGTFTYTFQVKNRTADTLNHLYLSAPGGTSMTAYVPIVPPLAPSQTSGPLTVSITTNLAPGSLLCFDFSAHDSKVEDCCYGEHCIKVPDCGDTEGADEGGDEGGEEGSEEGEGPREGEGHADGGTEAETGPCLNDLDCDDGDPCTNDICEPATGGCIHIPIVPCGEAEEEAEHEAEQDGEGDGCDNPNIETCTAGIQDEFSLNNAVELTTPSAALIAAIDCPGGGLNKFDVMPVRQCFVHTFSKCCLNDCEILDARLRITLRANPSSVAGATSDDLIRLGSNGVTFWSQAIINLNALGQYAPSTWNPGDTRTITLNLKSLPINATPANNVDITNQFDLCQLDVMVKDYTAVDHMSLEVVKCCSSGGTGEPVACDVAIVCPQQPLAVGSTLQLCITGDVKCVGNVLRYEWYRNGLLVSTSPTNPCLTLSPVSCGHAGLYTLSIVGSIGTFTTAPCKIKVKPCPHDVDTNSDGTVALTEALRNIQFYNGGEYHCDPTSEDGFAPGPGPKDCLPHSGDYNPQDYKTQLSELLRMLQFYNLGGMVPCPDADPPTEDGYCVAVP